MSPHRRANLLLFLVNDKPPFNRRLCVRNFFFPARLPSLPPSLSPPFSKQSGKVALPSSCVGFCAFFFNLAGERVSGRGRPLRGGGDGGSSGGGGGGTRVHAAAAGERAGSYAAVQGLRQSGRVGQNLRPGGTSTGSCGRETRQESEGREPERRARDTDRQQGGRESSLGLTEGEPECSESELPLGSESRESRSEHNPPPPPVRAPSPAGTRAVRRERERRGGREGRGRGRSPALPPCSIHLLSEMTLLLRFTPLSGKRLFLVCCLF